MAITQISSVSWDQGAYEKLLYFAFNENNVFDQIASVGVTNATNPGATVTFFKANNIAPTTATLSETADVTPVALSDSNLTLSLTEHGLAVTTTQLVRLISMIPVIPAVATLLGINSAQSMDLTAVAALAAGANVKYSGSALGAGSRVGIASGNVLSSADVRIAKNRLRRASVPQEAGLYNFHLHSDALYDLLTETGGLGWTDLMKYVESGVSNIRTFDVGVYLGFRFVETAHAPILVGGGSGTTPNIISVYQSFASGYQALAKGYSDAEGYGPNPIPVMSPTTDSLRRFLGWGWKHFVGYGVFRDESLLRIESSSSLGVKS